MSISVKTLDQRILWRHVKIQRKVDPMGLKPQAGIIADVTGAAPSGFGTKEPVAVTHEKLQRLLDLDVILAGSVKNRLGGGDKLAVSVKLKGHPDDWMGEVCEGIPETGRLLNVLRGLYALKSKLDTLIGRTAEDELRALIDDPSRVRAALAELAGPADDPDATPPAKPAGKK